MAPFLSRRVICSLACVAVFLILPSLTLSGQDDPRPPEPASDALAPLETNTSSPAQRDVSWRLLPNSFLHDQENILLFPDRLARSRHWSPTIAVVAATAGLLTADPNVEPYFDRTAAFHGFDRAFASKLTGEETIAIPAALYLIGVGNRDSYMQKTALFAGEAVLDSEVVRMVINSVTARWRPSDVARQATYGGTFFHDSVHVGSSFPSGHMIAAVSIATVVARRYRKHRWVPWVAYGLAGTIGFSRITLRAHFPSDVFLGGVLGYAVARYDVLQDH